MDRDRISLPSGMELHANKGIVGINAEGGIFHGYDGPLGSFDPTDTMTPQDRWDLGKLMLQRWACFMGRAKLDGGCNVRP